MATGAPLPVREYTDADQMRREAAALRARMFGSQTKTVRIPEKPPAAEIRSEPKVDEKGFLPPKPVRPEDFKDRSTVSMKRLTDVVAHVTGVSVLELACQRRLPHQVKARQILYWLGKNFTALSLPQIAYRVGRRDHTTALWGIRKVQAIVERLDIETPDCPVAAAQRLWAADWTARAE